MQKLKECIKDNTIKNTKAIQRCILAMICSDDEPIPLSQESLIDALELDGEFLVLKLNYDNFEDELKNETIKYKISQALSVVVSYEHDGKCFSKIEKFIKYIHNNSDVKQNSIFGVKNVDKLSEFPITILFSGILPINQLEMRVGKKIDALIHSDDEYFMPRFAKHRDDISKEIGIPILPVLPMLDEKLGEFQVRLVDLLDGRVISEFEVCKKLTKESVDVYLLKLFYIYKVLAQEKKCKQQLSQKGV